MYLICYNLQGLKILSYNSKKGRVRLKVIKAIIQFIQKYKHGFILLYFFVYLKWFFHLEDTVTNHYHLINSRLDALIPFNEVFIIPYFLWFLYIAVTIIYFLFASKQNFYKYIANLFIGMTLCLVVYTVWPNGHHLRVNLSTLGRSNIFITMLSTIYSLDTATNVFPSIHVFNSIASMIAIHKSEQLQRFKWIQWSAFILTLLICMSTVFLKQHSVIDILGGIGLNIILYLIIYVPSWEKVKLTKKERPEEFSNI